MSWEKAVEIARAYRHRGWNARITWRKGYPVVLAAKRAEPKAPPRRIP